MSMYGPNELNTELNRIEQAASQPSSSSNAYAQSLERVRAFFAEGDLQAKRVILQQRLERWREGNDQLRALARALQADVGPIQSQARSQGFSPLVPMFSPSSRIISDYVSKEEEAEAPKREAAAKEREARKQEAEKQFTIFEEYRRLSYHLNKEDKIDGERIRRTDPKSDYDFIVKAPDNSGNEQLYFAKRIKTTHDDLVPFILIPQDQSKQPCEVRLTFQGTSSLNGWYRNFTGQGSAGITDFNANKATMIAQLAEEIGKLPGDVNLSIIGHSLGGADSQNMMTEVMRVIDSGKEPRLNKIKGLSLYAYNSAGVTEETKKESLVLAKIMHERGIDISAHFSIVGGDIVQQTGDTNILIGLPRSDGRFVLVKTQAGQEGVYQGVSSAYAAGWATLDAHVGQIFTPKEQGGALEQVQSREFFFNNDEAGLRAIHEKCGQHKLSKKMPWTYYIGQLSKGMTKVAGRRLWEGTTQDLEKLVGSILTEKYFMESEATADLITEIIGLQPVLVNRFFELNENGTSFFIECAKQGRADIVSALSKHQSLISQKDSSGKTALLYAIENGHNDCVAVLVGAVDLKNEPEAIKLISGKPEMLQHLLSRKTFGMGMLASLGWVPSVSRGQVDEAGNTMFHYLAQNNDPEVAKKFAETLFSDTPNATSPDVLLMQKNKEGKTPLDYIVENRRNDIIGAIERRVAELKADNQKWTTGATVSWLAQNIGLGYKGKMLGADTMTKLEAAKREIENRRVHRAPRP